MSELYPYRNSIRIKIENKILSIKIVSINLTSFCEFDSRINSINAQKQKVLSSAFKLSAIM